MQTLFDPALAKEIKQRIASLTPASQRQWGTMTPAQALAHCSMGMEMATGERRPPRMMIGRILGPVIKHFALKDDEPMRRNSPTMPELVVKDDRDFAAEQARLVSMVDGFTTGGCAACTPHPHSFFGKLTPEQWGVLMYKHLDHHLRQFGA